MTTNKPAFTHLHTHTEYSLLDGISTIPALVARAQELEMDALAITDHGAMYGAIDFYSECKEQGVKPIIGCEIYVTDLPLTERGPHVRQRTYHSTILCQNNEGYSNLVKLVTKAHLEGFYYRPRIDLDSLARQSSGLICLSGCPSGQLQRQLGPAGNWNKAVQIAQTYRDIFGDRYWLEIQKHKDVPDLDHINQKMVELSKSTGIDLVATNDGHYTRKEDAAAHNLFMAMQTQDRLDNDERLTLEDDSYYLRSPYEMDLLFSDIPGVIERSVEIGQGCKVELDFGRKRLPDFPKPDGLSSDQYLRRLCEQGFSKKCPANDSTYRDRLEYELGVVEQTQFADYFLIVWDIIKFARDRQIQLTVRGSAAASLVLYCLDITPADPIRYSLVFERFLNLERKEMPDVDMDFQDNRRDEVTRYVLEKYGSERVAQIGTFNRYGVKSVLRAAGRVVGLDQQVREQLSKAAPTRATSVEEAIKANPDLGRMGQRNEKVAQVLKNTQGLEGVVNHTGSHPAGVVISSEPLDEIAPLQMGSNTKASGESESGTMAITQYSMDPIAKLGLLKMDFLGLKNLTILDDAMKLVKDGPTDLNQIPLDDQAVYELLASGNTSMVFQLESAGMQRHIKDLKPTSVHDIAAMIALYRPGPMDNIERFIRSKHGLERTTFPHPSMEQLLEETYGVIVYQDQVLQILQNFAGYTMGAADIVRKAMGKKIPKLMQEERERFVEKAQHMGHHSDIASEIFDIIEPFAGYAFNKAHSVSYGLITYWTAWYKANHPTEYMTAALNGRQDDRDKYLAVLDECRRMRVRLEPPNINSSDPMSRPAEGKQIIMGLTTISGIGEEPARAIAHNRKSDGPFKSITDFCSRGPKLHTRAVEAIVKSGAMDEIGPRAVLLRNAEAIAGSLNSQSDARQSGQLSMMSMTDEDDSEWLDTARLPRDDDEETLMRWEREALGTTVTWDPMDMLKGVARRNDIMRVADLDEYMSDHTQTESPWVAGVVQSIDTRKARDDKQYKVIDLGLSDGNVEVRVWDDRLIKSISGIDVHTPIRTTGIISENEGAYRLRADQIVNLNEPVREDIAITISTSGRERQDRQRFQAVIRVLVDHPGDDAVTMSITTREETEVANLEIGVLTADGSNHNLRERLNELEGVRVAQSL